MKKSNFLVAIILFIALTVIPILNLGCTAKRDWSISEPEEQGMNSEILGQITDHVKEDLPGTTSVLVIRNGYIIFEEYYVGDRNTQRHLWSVTRSFTSALIGIAIDQGYIKSVDQKVLDFFPEFKSENLNPYIEDLTIFHLLTMTSGFNDITNIKKNLKEMKKMLEYSDHLPPGSTFLNDGNCSHLLSMIITKATGETLEEYGKKYLLDPLGIKDYSWNGVYGYTFGSSTLYLNSRDLAKFGYLYQEQGTWGKNRLFLQIGLLNPHNFILIYRKTYNLVSVEAMDIIGG